MKIAAASACSVVTAPKTQPKVVPLLNRKKNVSAPND